MKHILVTLAFLGAAFLALPALASNTCTPDLAASVLSNVALNGTAATRTITLTGGSATASCPLPLTAYRHLDIYTAYTHSQNGALTWTCKVGSDSGSAVYVPTTCTTSTGTCALNTGGVMATASLSADYYYDAGPMRIHALAIRCTISHGGSPGAGDLVTARVLLTTD
jgi:hypothetical protein